MAWNVRYLEHFNQISDFFLRFIRYIIISVIYSEQEVSMMRQKGQKKYIYAIAIQLIGIYCGMIFWTFKFQSQTSAAYNDIERVSFQITADWIEKDKDKGKDKPEKPSLYFIKQEVQCKNSSISGVIRNTSQSIHMKHSAVYEVYWSENGNPKPVYGGKKVQSGTIPALRAGKSHTIAFKVTKPGNYILKISYSNHDIWSNVLQVDKKCIDDRKPVKEKHQSEINTSHTENENTFKQENSSPQIETSEELEELQEPAVINEIQIERKEDLSEDTLALD